MRRPRSLKIQTLYPRAPIHHITGVDYDHRKWTVSSPKSEAVWKLSLFDGTRKDSVLWSESELLELYSPVRFSERSDSISGKDNEILVSGVRVVKSSCAVGTKIYNFTMEAHADISYNILKSTHIITRISSWRSDLILVSGFYNGQFNDQWISGSDFAAWYNKKTPPWNID